MTASDKRSRPVHLMPLLMTIALGACGTTPPSNFYLLEPAVESDSKQVAAGRTSTMHIGIGPIEFAEYLDRPQIVTRTQSARVSLSETHRWAEPLQNNFARILADNLSYRLNTDKVTLYPSRNWPDIHFQVLVDVWQFDASSSGDATLVANWSIRNGKGTRLLFMKKSVFTATVEPAGSHAAIAAALSTTVDMLGKEIADAINEHNK